MEIKTRKLSETDSAFIYVNYKIDPDDFRLIRKTSDDFVLWSLSRNKEVYLRR